ncbi:RING 1A, partial [Prunus dulcis]
NFGKTTSLSEPLPLRLSLSGQPHSTTTFIVFSLSVPQRAPQSSNNCILLHTSLPFRAKFSLETRAMPAQKRTPESVEDDPLQNHHENSHDHPQDEEVTITSICMMNWAFVCLQNANHNMQQLIVQLQYGCPGWDTDMESSIYIIVKLAEIRKEVQCPICLGIIRKTRTVMECLHRFCRECIDKSMRLGNNECPACRTHCASRRSLRDDPNYDALIAAIYPDIDKYEEEELAFHEEEKARNKQIQASIAQTFRRQSEALGRKRTTAKATAAAFMRRSQGSDDNEDANGNDGGKDSTSGDERTEPRPKRCKRWGGGRSGSANADGGDENDYELNREIMGASAGLVGSSERLAWGKGGMRSHTRYGSTSGGNGKNARNIRLSKLVEYLRNSENHDDELDIHLLLVSFDEQRIPSLQRPYLCCRPTLSVGQLCHYVALRTALQADEVELYLVKELHAKFSHSTATNVLISKSVVLDSTKDNLQLLREQETLADLRTHNLIPGHLNI